MCNSPPPGAVGPGSRCVPKLESSWLPITLSQGISSRFVRYEAVQLLEGPGADDAAGVDELLVHRIALEGGDAVQRLAALAAE